MYCVVYSVWRYGFRVAAVFAAYQWALIIDVFRRCSASCAPHSSAFQVSLEIVCGFLVEESVVVVVFSFRYFSFHMHMDWNYASF
ncbi:MAG: hypothetical protein QXZ70_08535 [Candidatus Bathyarchaeia archaeon]